MARKHIINVLTTKGCLMVFFLCCSKDCLDIARECYHGPSLSADAARAIAALRKQLYAATESGEAPLASSYHVLGAMRLAAMHLARRWYMAKGAEQ